MGTGIVSVVLADAGRESLSRALLVVSWACLLALAAVLTYRALRDRPRLRREACTPASLTAVAAPAVVGSRVLTLGWLTAAALLLGVAALAWICLMPRVIGHWRVPTDGASFVVVVATESLAVLAAAVAAREAAPWLLYAALAGMSGGVGLYVWVAARFSLRHLVAGRGDHWVAGGALAISALACAHVTQAARGLGVLGDFDGALQACSLMLWLAALAWLVVLVASELAVPRPGYDVRRWSTVFPVGMYAACSFAVGGVSGHAWIGDAARAWTWVAFAVWLLVMAGTIGRALTPQARGAQGDG